MKTDKQLYRLFQANPDWLFELTRLASPGPSVLRSFTLKALERAADGVIVPQDAAQPLTVVEFQFDTDATIYTRIVNEMTAVQVEQGMRAVQGIIVFRHAHLDPRTEPWTKVVSSFLLRALVEALAAEQPQHPLVAVFQPVLLTNAETLQQQAVQYYRQIKQSALAEPLKTTLVEVFVSWLRQRLSHLGRKEIEAMFLGELPALEDTQSGKELIQLGEARGKASGLAEAIRLFLEDRHGPLPEPLRQRLPGLSLDALHALLPLVSQGMTLEQLQAWLTAHS